MHLTFLKIQLKLEEARQKIKNKYCISIIAKKRYTNPLVLMNGKPIRIENASKKGKEIIKDIKNFKDSKYAFFKHKSITFKINKYFNSIRGG